MSLPHPRQAANILTQGISSIDSLSKSVMGAFTNAQINMIRTLAEAAPELPSFTTGQRRVGVSAPFPQLERVFSAVPDTLSKLAPRTGYTEKGVKGIDPDSNRRYRGDVAMF